MKFKKTLSVLVAAFIFFGGFTQVGYTPLNTAQVSAATTSSSDGKFTLTDDTLSIINGSDTIDLQVCSSNIMKVNYKPGGSEDSDTPVIDPDLKWNTGNIVSSDLTADPVVLKTNSMTIKISKSDLSVSVYNSSNGLLLKQSSLTSSKSVTFSHSSGQNFYGVEGLGTTNGDNVIRTGAITVQAGAQGHCGAPFVWTTGGYGLLVDSDGGSINVQDTSLAYTGISKKNTEYYVMVGDPTAVLTAEAKISGTSPMFPKWATGFTNTQWGWSGSGTDEDQLKAVISKYRSQGYPIDNFCLDFDWKNWGTGDYSEFKWSPTNFPNGQSGADKTYFDSQGLHLTGIYKPRIFKNTAEAAEADAGSWWYTGKSAITDYCAGPSMLNAQHQTVQGLDYSNPSVRSWWWSQEKSAFDTGIVGYWNDECDAASDNGFKNLDNLYMQKANYDGQTSSETQRVWSINRTYYAGAQRYGYGLWSGDINSDFSTMQNQEKNLIASVNLGEAKWGMDTGGFQGTPTSEMYARWLEFSAFVPIFRVHGTKNQVRYPWAFGDVAATAAKNVMTLRYQLIPYIYKYDAQASDTGIGLVKSLMMAYPNDPNTAKDTDSWMFGDYLLVSPVVQQSQTSKSIYLPKGTWTDYNTGKTYVGGKTIDYAVDSNSWKDVPLFIKQGAIIPSQDFENYVGEKKMTNIYVDVFPDTKSSSFDYYDDDGNTYTYKSGNYFEQNLSVSKNSTKDGVEFKTAAKEGNYTPDVQDYIVKMHVTSTGGAVTVGGQTLTKYASLDALKSATGEGYAVGKDTYGDVVYAKIASGQVKDVNIPCNLPEAPTQKATVYAKSTSTSSTLQYSVDNGATWSAGQAMTQSDKIGYLQSAFSYSLSDADAVKVRMVNGTSYSPSSDGIALTGDGDTFTISKDGTVSTGTPVMNTSTVYIQTSKAASPILQYQDANGNWSSSLSMDAWPGDSTKTEYSKSLSYSADDSAPIIRYSEDGGTTWKPSASGQSIGQGDYMNDSTGSIVSGKPSWKQLIIIHFKAPTGWAAPNIYSYSSDGNNTQYTGAWPGTKMTSDGNGWYSYTIDKDVATSKVIFDDGKNQTPGHDQPGIDVSVGESWYDGTTSTLSKVNPSAPTIKADVAGGNYQATQKVTLTTTSGATIYYTLDGTIPTASSTKYTGPITIDTTKTLEAIAIDANGNQSAVDIESYTIGSSSGTTTPGTTTPGTTTGGSTTTPGTTTGGSTTTPGTTTGGSTTTPGGTTTYDALKSVTVSSNNVAAKVGDKITLTANVNTTDPSVQYAFGYFDNNNNWKVLSNFSSLSTAELPVSAVGQYTIYAMAKSNTVSQINSSPITVTVSSASSQPGNTFDNNQIMNVFAIMVLSSIAVAFIIKRKRTI